MTEEYYKKHKHEWRKGGKYYNYIRKEDRPTKTMLAVRRGKFLISFD